MLGWPRWWNGRHARLRAWCPERGVRVRLPPWARWVGWLKPAATAVSQPSANSTAAPVRIVSDPADRVGVAPTTCPSGGTAYAAHSKCVAREGLWVRIPPWARNTASTWPFGVAGWFFIPRSRGRHYGDPDAPRRPPAGRPGERDNSATEWPLRGCLPLDSPLGSAVMRTGPSVRCPPLAAGPRRSLAGRPGE